jgi:hypothetical protein
MLCLLNYVTLIERHIVCLYHMVRKTVNTRCVFLNVTYTNTSFIQASLTFKCSVCQCMLYLF